MSSSIISSPVTVAGSWHLLTDGHSASRPLLRSNSLASAALFPYEVYDFYQMRVRADTLADYYTLDIPDRTSLSQWYRTGTISFVSEYRQKILSAGVYEVREDPIPRSIFLVFLYRAPFSL